MGISGIGYEGLTLDALIHRLRQSQIDILVDVRLNAVSRKPGFSKKALAAALEKAGIQYVHLPNLGNERENRAGYAELTSESARQARAGFRDRLGGGAAVDSLGKLTSMARERSVAVFCFEADERHCHREQVIETVRELLRSSLVDA